MHWHGGRALLNSDGFQSTAAIVAEIEDTSAWSDGKDRDGDDLSAWGYTPRYTLQLSDCDRSISFDLDMDSPEGRKNDLHKIDTIIRTLRAFRTGLAAEQRRMVAREKLIEARDD